MQINKDIDEIRDKFRQESRLLKYNPYLHIANNIGLLLSSVLLFTTQINHLRLSELWVIPSVLLMGNLVVYILHRFPLHGRYKWNWNAYAYKNHTLRHHRFFDHNNTTFKDKYDWFSVFFPKIVIVGFVTVYNSISYFALSCILSENEVNLFLVMSSFYFLLYEFVHYCSHLPLNHVLLKNPWLRYMHSHHQIHHNPQLMTKYNFCIVYPLFDFIFKSKFKNQIKLNLKEKK